MKKLLIFSLFCLFFSCQEEAIVMRYQMTGCADEWMRDPNYFQNKEAVVKTFLTNKGIAVRRLVISSDCTKQQLCLACTCKGCDFATVETDEDSEEKLRALGFERQ